MVFLIIIIVVLGGGLCAAIFFIGQDEKANEEAKRKQAAAYQKAVIERHSAWCRKVASVGGIVPASSATIQGLFLEPDEVLLDVDANAAQLESVTITNTDNSGMFFYDHKTGIGTYLDASRTTSRTEIQATKGILAITSKRIIFISSPTATSSSSTWTNDIDRLLGCSADYTTLQIIPSYGGKALRFRTADAMIMEKMIKIFRFGNPTSFCAHLPPNQRLEYVQSL